jgi:tetratricopeptide (TPR) repeat protein
MTGIIRSFSCLCLCSFTMYAACPATGSFGGSAPVEKKRLLKGIIVETLDNACMDTIIEALKSESDDELFLQVEKLIETWSVSNGFSLSLLSRCADIPFFAREKDAGRRITAMWERRNKPLDEAIEYLSNSGRQDEADSLFHAFDRCVKLGPDALLRWAAVKETRGMYNGMLSLYCRSINTDPRSAGFALGRLSQFLENAPSDTVHRMLCALGEGVLSARGIDTLMTLVWIADMYAEHGFISEEIRILERSARASPELIVRLLDIARNQERKGAREPAVAAARIVYQKAQNDQLRQTAAAIACRSFQELHRTDSALVWLERCDVSTERGKIDAIVLFQNANKPTKAQSMIGGMRKSFSRDTLEIRQRLYIDDARGGLELATGLGRVWTDRTAAITLWKVRCMLFCGVTENFGAILDSATVDPSQESGRELVDYRYYWNMLSRSKDAIAAWRMVEYDLYTGRAERAVDRMQGIVLPEEMQTALLLRLLRVLKAQGRTALLLRQFIGRSDIPGSPEYAYLHAETLLESGGGSAEAVELLLRLIKDYPADVFSQKARILLSRLRNKS